MNGRQIDEVRAVVEAIDQFEQGTNFQAWAYQTARYKVQHYYRTRSRDATTLAPEVLDLLAAESERSGDDLTDLRAELAECMQKLKPADLEVVRRCYADNITIPEVAAQIGRPLDTIKSVLKRSRRQLYECVRRTQVKEGRP